MKIKGNKKKNQKNKTHRKKDEFNIIDQQL